MKKHTDSGFTFDIKEDHAAVMEIDGDPQIVEIPEQIDGVPVTELAEYLFSGKSCQVIRIPLGVQKIGRYGFYNCRNLEELWFSTAFREKYFIFWSMTSVLRWREPRNHQIS